MDANLWTKISRKVEFTLQDLRYVTLSDFFYSIADYQYRDTYRLLSIEQFNINSWRMTY